jgi:hypothetical protein
MAGTTKYWGFFDPKLIITGFRDNGSLAEMISLSYGIEAVTFESCGVPIKPGSTWKGKVNAVITRYVFTPNLTNTQFPIPKNSNITTYCLFHVNPEEIAKKISEKTTMSYSVSSRVVNTSKEIGAHGLSHSVDHFAIKAGLEKLIERGFLLGTTAAYFRSACVMLLTAFIYQRDYIPQDLLFQVGLASAPSGHVGKILGELMRRSHVSNISVFAYALDREQLSGKTEANFVKIVTWPRQLDCLNLETRREINLLVNRIAPTQTYIGQTLSYISEKFRYK